jgi:hypothetical protein
MPTDNPKISAYVPQVVYDYFDEFRRESGLSMSQSAAVIFAKFFGLEDIAKEITGETTTDNSALDRIKLLESQVDDLFKKISELESKPKSELLSSSLSAEPNTSDVYTGDLLEGLLGGLPTQIMPIMGKTLIKRLIAPSTGKSVSSSKLSTESKKSTDEFRQWTSELDIDNIQWEYKGRKVGYVPAGELSDELRSRLLKWIEENS